MKATVRPLEDTDLPGVGSLRVLAFPDFPEVRDVGFYDSVYRWLGSHPLAGELRRWVAVTGKGEVVGHLSAIPQYYRVGGRRVVAHTPADYMSHPEYGFYAFLLMRKFFGECENCVACDMVPGVIGIETRLGAETAGELSYALKLLNVSRLPLPPVPAPARRLLNLPAQEGIPARWYPGQETGNDGTEIPRDFQERAPATRPRLPLPAPVCGLLNGGLRAVDGALGRTFGDGPEVEVLEKFDASFDHLFESVASAVPCTPERDAAFLRWRYGPGSPQWPIDVLGVRDEERLLGYAVLKVTDGMDGYLLDLTAFPGRRDVSRALLLESVRHLRRAGAHVVRYRYQDSPTSARRRDLRRLGFFYRQGRRNTLLVKLADPHLQEAARDIRNWSYTVGDGEASFWMR